MSTYLTISLGLPDNVWLELLKFVFDERKQMMRIHYCRFVYQINTDSSLMLFWQQHCCFLMILCI